MQIVVANLIAQGARICLKTIGRFLYSSVWADVDWRIVGKSMSSPVVLTVEELDSIVGSMLIWVDIGLFGCCIS